MRFCTNAALGVLAFATVAVGTLGAQAAQQPTTQATAAPAAPAGPQGTPKIAYINSQVILAQAPGRAEAEQQFQKEMSTYKQEVQRMGDSLNTLVADYNKQEATLSPAAKSGKQKEIRDKETAYQQRVQQLEQRAQQREAELMRPLMEQINKLIEQIRVENGYSYVLDAGSAAGVVVAADTSLNITDKVLARLKAAGPPPLASTAPASPAAKPATKPASGPTTKPAGVTRPKSPGTPPTTP